MVVRSLLALVLALPVLLGACDADRQDVASAGPQATPEGIECHLCGMVVTRFPGPRGQVAAGATGTRHFCSTRDLFAWLLQPENAALARSAWVHDMAGNDWDAPADHFTDARTAWYVWGHPRQGAMGHTLASFARKEDAEAFRTRWGGELYRYEDITLALISTREAL